MKFPPEGEETFLLHTEVGFGTAAKERRLSRLFLPGKRLFPNHVELLNM
jgi:hypothetical protein